MSKSEIRRLEREIQKTQKKVEAVQKGEWWPLTARERLAMTRALASGARSVHKGRSTGGAETRMESIDSSVTARLNAELTALHGEKLRLHTEAARAKAEKKKSGWW
jgi:multidrug resistance efflux pump